MTRLQRNAGDGVIEASPVVQLTDKERLRQRTIKGGSLEPIGVAFSFSAAAPQAAFVGAGPVIFSLLGLEAP